MKFISSHSDLHRRKGPSRNTSGSFYFLFKKKGGGGVEPPENRKLEEKPEENIREGEVLLKDKMSFDR